MSCMQVVSCCRAVSVPRGVFPGRRTPETSVVSHASQCLLEGLAKNLTYC